MKLFRKKEVKKGCCGTIQSNSLNEETKVRIKVLGSGCAKCITLEKNVKEALLEMGKLEAIQHVTDFADIATYGVMSTPALVVDEKVVSFGKVLNKVEIIALLNQAGF